MSEAAENQTEALAGQQVEFESAKGYEAHLDDERSVVCLPVVGGYAFEFRKNGEPCDRIALTCDAFDAMALLAHHIETDRSAAALEHSVGQIILPN